MKNSAADIDRHLANDNRPILILSGEGECGEFEIYEGKRTGRAILQRLAKKRSHGDRFARVFLWLHEGCGMNMEEDGAYDHLPDNDELPDGFEELVEEFED